MALTKIGLSALFKELEKQERAQEKAIRQVRGDAYDQTLLTPRKLEEAAKSDQNLILAYGRMGHQVSFSPAELREFLRARRRIAKQYADKKQGAPLRALLASSLPIDKQRAKTVKAAILYGRKGNIPNFMVSGVQRPQYRVQIRLEGWDKALTTNTKALKAAQQMVNGRLSIECSCGRHQYWYRYLATIGSFAIQPQEHDFPKIKNPNLRGCCCKHILKVLGELSKSRVLFAIAQELDKDRNKPGFSGNQSAHVLNNAQLRRTTARMSANARLLMDDWKQQVEKLRLAGKQTPTGGKKTGSGTKGTTQKKNTSPNKQTAVQKPVTQADAKLITAIGDVLKAARGLGMKPDTMLDAVASSQNISRAQIDQIIKDNNL